MSRLQALAVGKACYEKLYIDSRLKKGTIDNPWLPPGDKFLRPQYPTAGQDAKGVLVLICTEKLDVQQYWMLKQRLLFVRNCLLGWLGCSLGFYS